MKRYIKSNQEPYVHISDLFEGIRSIVVVNDATRFNMSSITGSYKGLPTHYSKFELLSLSDKELKSILDIKTLKEIIRWNNAGEFENSPDSKIKRKYYFSDEQIAIIRSEVDTHFQITDEDLHYTMECLTDCPTLKIYPTEKNNIFETVFGMTDETYKEIFQNLEQYYEYNTSSYDLEYLEDNLMVFKPTVDLVMYNPELDQDVTLHNLELYVKLNLDKTIQETVNKYGIADMDKPFVTAIVSFHLSDFDNNFDKYKHMYDQIIRKRRKSK